MPALRTAFRMSVGMERRKFTVSQSKDAMTETMTMVTGVVQHASRRVVEMVLDKQTKNVMMETTSIPIAALINVQQSNAGMESNKVGSNVTMGTSLMATIASNVEMLFVGTMWSRQSAAIWKNAMTAIT